MSPHILPMAKWMNRIGEKQLEWKTSRFLTGYEFQTSVAMRSEEV